MQRYRVLYLQVPIQLTCYKSLGFALSVDFAVLIYLIFIYRGLYQLPAFAIIKNHANNSGQCLLFLQCMSSHAFMEHAPAGQKNLNQADDKQAKKSHFTFEIIISAIEYFEEASVANRQKMLLITASFLFYACQIFVMVPSAFVNTWYLKNWRQTGQYSTHLTLLYLKI